MRDRFPLLVIGALLLTAVLGTLLVRSAARASFADPLSTYRAEQNGTRALFLLAKESGLPVVRRMSDLRLLNGPASLVLLSVEMNEAHEQDPDQTQLAAQNDAGLSDEETPHTGFNTYRAHPVDAAELKQLLASVEAGGTLVYVPWGSQENALLDALHVTLDKADTSLPMRTLVPAMPTPYTRGVERVEARVQAYLRLPEDAIPVLDDERLDRPVAALVPHGEGQVLILGAPELAMNQALARADNAQFWLSTLAAMGSRPIEFDEYHHGFTNERSIIDFARRYGLHFAVAQLLLGVALWAVSLKRFGRPLPPAEAVRVGSTDALFAMGRLYREGRHHAFAAGLIAQGLTQQLALYAGMPAQSPARAVSQGLSARGREDLAQGLLAVANAASSATTDTALQHLAAHAARVRERIHPAGDSRPLTGTP
ncbi:hypothetical protein DRW03_01765 [Corallococcus sp. H22C18031201]|uniref:DUF4350 domain-containing protein n=1 Tax=Citreicoccus inhibens TaxID=2849499 RepID=UPI000E7218AB|nr:DUF4350 domain-containing protein [Citreicoccus inhibens]MBU8894970.1 hypothetical protein [Citreicoccus inhibens]RJS27129.1 hypothetical protein DRW03_01765 [Corallococcus sp. H22C18031201]